MEAESGKALDGRLCRNSIGKFLRGLDAKELTMRMMALCMALAVSTALSTGAIAVAELPAAEQAAVFKAAGFTRHGAQWRSDCDDPGTPSYSPGQIDQVRDINGDGRLEVVITEGGTYCYGMTGSAFWIVSQQADGRWRLITSSIGIPAFLATRGRAAGPISRSADPASLPGPALER